MKMTEEKIEAAIRLIKERRKENAGMGAPLILLDDALRDVKQMKGDLLQIRKKTLEHLNNALQGESLNFNNLVVFIEEKTAHYENQTRSQHSRL